MPEPDDDGDGDDYDNDGDESDSKHLNVSLERTTLIDQPTLLRTEVWNVLSQKMEETWP